jgi:aminopeptidase
MSIEAFGRLIEKSCLLDRPDPALEWQQMADEQQALCAYLDTVDELHIESRGTDLTLSVKDRTWISCHGKSDLPDGEVFTGPIEDSVNGTVAFTYPARRVDGIVLTFKDGVVVDHAAERGEEHLEQMLQIEGGNRLGEIGIGTNYDHQTHVNHILFDEKMGGTVHLALGGGFPESGSKNVSGLHWDMLLDMRPEGRMYADGKLIYEKGRFLT